METTPPTPPTTPPAAPPPGTPPDTEGQLGKLQRQLYAREESADMKQRGEELHQLGIRRKALTPSEDANKNPSAFERLADIRAKRRKRFYVIGGVAAALLLLFGSAIGGTIWYRLRHNIRPEQIHLSLAAPEQFTAGEAITYVLEYRNDSFVDWQKLELHFEPPSGFRYRESSQELKLDGKKYIATIPQLKSKEAGKIEITGQLIGEQNAALVAKADLFFVPENSPSLTRQTSALTSTTITIVPVDVSIDTTDEAESGQRLLVTIHIRNNSSQVLSDTYLQLNPSPGIQLAAEDQQFSPGFSALDSAWELGTLEPLSEVTRSVVMFAEGQAGERRTLDVELGLRDGDQKIVQRTHSQVITITASALAIEQVYNSSEEALVVNPGETINGDIHYSNIGNTGMKNVVVKVQFEGTGINAESLRLPTGAYDPIARTITWTAATVPELATLQPKQTGTIAYSFSMLPADQFPTTGENLKNNLLIALASIDSPDLITATGEKRNLVSDRTVLSVATTMLLDAAAFYDDGRLGIKSDGPVPPKAGEQTTYTVRLRVGSLLNDMGDVRLRAVLPDGVRYTGKTYKTSGEVEFSDRTGEVFWNLPTLKGLTGRTLPTEELHFQVAITPGENQRGEQVPFLNNVTVEGTDLFTENAVSATVTNYPSTETAVQNQGNVE
ncbi:MAG: hypothetical protein WD972_03770 [Candidatus Andersenbacteria bacterium]